MIFTFSFVVSVLCATRSFLGNHTMGAVIVDSRFDRDVIASIANARVHIPLHMRIYIITAGHNFAEARATAKTFINVALLDRIDYSSADITTYNTFLKTKDVWDIFTEEYILIFQRDSRFCTGSHSHVVDFVGHYDYIGAPWASAIGNARVGNGGFSLRSRAAMLKCCNRPDFPSPQINEDVSFANCVNDLGLRMATPADAASFSIETISMQNQEAPLGVHKPWLYIQNDTTIKWLARYCHDAVGI